MGKRTIRRHAFTLVELLAAMAVFSILLLVSMQIFSGAQNIWVRSEQKNDLFAESRQAMEFLTSRIDTVHYNRDIFFRIANDTRNNGTLRQNIYFATMMPMNRQRANGDKIDASMLRFLSFQVVDDDPNNPSGALKMMILSDHDPAYDGSASGTYGDPNFEYLLPPYENESVAFSSLKLCGDKNDPSFTTTRQNVFSAIQTNLDSKANDSDPEGHYPKDVVVLAENVARLRFNAYNVDLSVAGRSRHKKKDFLQNLAKDSTNPIVALPYLLEIELTVFDTKEHYQQWYNASDAEKQLLLEQYSYTFNRSLLFGDRM